MGHTYLLVGDKAQAQPWYQKTLHHLTKDEELQQGPLDDFNLFINSGWAVADAEAAKQWFEQTWPKLVALRKQRQAAVKQAKQGQPLEVMQQLLAWRAQTVALVGEGDEADVYWFTWSSIAHTTLDDLIENKHPHAQAMAFVESALQGAGIDLPDERRWRLLDRLATRLNVDDQKALALRVQERIYAEQQAKLGADHPDTLTSMSNLAVT